jgi:hypothetical protein
MGRRTKLSAGLDRVLELIVFTGWQMADKELISE